MANWRDSWNAEALAELDDEMGDLREDEWTLHYD